MRRARNSTILLLFERRATGRLQLPPHHSLYATFGPKFLALAHTNEGGRWGCERGMQGRGHPTGPPRGGHGSVATDSWSMPSAISHALVGERLSRYSAYGVYSRRAST